MDKVTLLSREQVFGKDEINIFNKIGRSATITDFAVLLGGFENNGFGYYWIKSDNIYNIINATGYKDYEYRTNRENGIRPVIPYSKIKNDSSYEITNEDGITEVEYGEYPQNAVDNILQEKLEELYKNNNLTETGKTYTTDSRKYNEWYKGFLPQEHIEYEFDDKKYVRIKANPCWDRLLKLSNGEEYKDGDYVWVEVSKIKWLIDKKNDIALSKDILVSGIQFDNKEKYTGAFENSNIYKYLNVHFIYDIQCISKISKKYKQVMELIEKEERRNNEILDKSIIGKSLIKHL